MDPRPVQTHDSTPQTSKPVIESQQVLAGLWSVKNLRAGAFGTVYHAHDLQLDREVALKVPNARHTRLAATR